MVRLHGYKHSVYAWIARLALVEKGVDYDWTEIDPFAPDAPAAYRDLHPFMRVPTLEHDGFVLYETQAIARYLDEAFPGPALQPADPRARARVAQIVGVVDSYAYWPLVRQVFAHGWFRAATGRAPDQAEAAAGMAAAPRVLDALEDLAGGGAFLVGDGLTLADLHLAPMIDYFARAPGAGELLAARPRLAGWFRSISARPAMDRTRPAPPDPTA